MSKSVHTVDNTPVKLILRLSYCEATEGVLLSSSSGSSSGSSSSHSFLQPGVIERSLIMTDKEG